MIYNKFKNLELSALGMGCMRLPTIEGKDTDIDIAAAREMVDYAIKQGVNYFDTAWGYHSGHSEPVMGEILSSYPRESFYLASKFPGYDLNNMDKVEEIFASQLERCRVDHFDFYLFHNVCEMNIEQYLDPKYRIFDYLTAQKRAGKIRHLGFSAHGNLETMKRFLDAYGDSMEFCQLQINWLDWHFQNAAEKVELVRSYGIPIWVMEPVRGGSLAQLSNEHIAMLNPLRPGIKPAEWAFRFLQGIPDAIVTLSGMSNLEQLKENIATYNENKAVNDRERSALFTIARAMTHKDTLPCTACRYCTSHCPQSLDIPMLIELYNEHIYSGGGFIAPMAMEALDPDKTPAGCIGCRKCEAVCPQGIKISEMMRDFKGKLADE